MADLLSTQTGRDALNRIACYLGRRRMARRLHRSFYIAFDEWKETGHFSLETLLNELNPKSQDEIEQLTNLANELGCLDGYTLSDRSYYVDSVNGDDIDGDGSEESPYASLAFLSSPSFPTNIEHDIRVLISGSVSADSMNFNQTIGDNGCLSICGMDDPTTVTTSQGAGPFTLTGVNSTGTPIRAWEFQVAETFGVDELYGKWIKFTTGAAAGEAIQIHDNTASSLWTRTGLTGVPLSGDAFIIVQPTAVVSCPQWNFEVHGPTWGDNGTEKSRFNLFNLFLDISDASIDTNNFVIRNTVESQFSFVNVEATTGQFNFVHVESPINRSVSADISAATLATTEITNLDKILNAGLFITHDAGPDVTRKEVTISKSVWVEGIDSRGIVDHIGSFGYVGSNAAGVMSFNQGAGGYVALNYVTGDSTDAGFQVINGIALEITVNYVKGGQDGVRAVHAGMQYSGNIHGTLTGHGFRYEAQASITVPEDPTALAGATGAIWFPAGTGTTAFPAADTFAVDTVANIFSRPITP